MEESYWYVVGHSTIKRMTSTEAGRTGYGSLPGYSSLDAAHHECCEMRRKELERMQQNIRDFQDSRIEIL